MDVKEGASIGAASLRRRTDILSSPMALFVGRLLMVLNISPQDVAVFFRLKVDSTGVI